ILSIFLFTTPRSSEPTLFPYTTLFRSRDQGTGPAASPVQPARAPLRRGEEPGREEEGDHRDRAHPAEDRLPGPQERDALPGPGRRLLHPAGITRPAPGIPAAPAGKAQPRLHHHHPSPGGRLTGRP